jgi:23S rRNA (guanine745-N1)-methyltransferase
MPNILQCGVNMVAPPLACTVRDCGLLLERKDRAYACARRHAYDLSKSGYLNLLQPTDRRSPAAGDARDAIVARARLLAQGVGASILTDIATRVASVANAHSVVADLGSGAGELLGTVYDRAAVAGIGLDLSAAAAEHAARRYPHLTWVVANVDRGIPLLDRSADVVVSLNGRRNVADCARVLAGDGRLIVGLPAPDDLIELREHMQGEATERDRADALIAEHEPLFDVLERSTVRERHSINADGLRDLLRGTYRGARASGADRLASLRPLDVTVASDVVVFVPKR